MTFCIINDRTACFLHSIFEYEPMQIWERRVEEHFQCLCVMIQLSTKYWNNLNNSLCSSIIRCLLMSINPCVMWWQKHVFIYTVCCNMTPYLSYLLWTCSFRINVWMFYVVSFQTVSLTFRVQKYEI